MLGTAVKFWHNLAMAHVFPKKLQHVSIVCTGEQIVCLTFAAKPAVPRTPAARQLAVLLARYFAGECIDFSHVPLVEAQGTAFQRRVWQAMRAIPYGEVRTYAEVAALIGQPRAVRAVGNAAAANPFVITTPCHRVIRSDGTLGNYGGGRARKQHLLALEGAR